MRVLITPEQVQNLGNEFALASKQSEDILKHLKSEVDKLIPFWEGMPGQRFYKDYIQWCDAMAKYIELLQQIGLELDFMTHRFACDDTDQISKAA